MKDSQGVDENNIFCVFEAQFWIPSGSGSNEWDIEMWGCSRSGTWGTHRKKMEQTETHIHTQPPPLLFEKVDGNKAERKKRPFWHFRKFLVWGRSLHYSKPRCYSGLWGGPTEQEKGMERADLRKLGRKTRVWTEPDAKHPQKSNVFYFTECTLNALLALLPEKWYCVDFITPTVKLPPLLHMSM